MKVQEAVKTKGSYEAGHKPKRRRLSHPSKVTTTKALKAHCNPSMEPHIGFTLQTAFYR